MAITIKPTESTIGAYVTNVDFDPMSDETWEEVYAAFLEYGLLVFPGLNPSEEAQGAFALRFGNVEQLSPKQEKPTLYFSNQKEDGSTVEPHEYGFKVARGNEGWHTDSTYMPLASKAAMLMAVVIPDAGGETEFADMRAGWDALDAETQAQCEGLTASHSLYYSQMKAGYTFKTDHLYGFHDKGAPRRPIVKVHPETGRKSIYTGRHAYGVDGMTEAESEEFLDKLLADACQPPRVYSHTWSVGDLVVWDNRCLMHRARPYDTTQPRILRASRIAGDAETELAPTFKDERASGFDPTESNTSKLAL